MSDPADSAPTLTVEGGPCDGRSLVLDHSMERVLGSGANCHLRLELANVEAEHAHVLWDDSGVQLKDFSAAAGTFVNGEKVDGQRTLEDGDRIGLGPPGSEDSAEIRVEIAGGLALESAPLSLPGDSEPVALGAEGEESTFEAPVVEGTIEVAPEPVVEGTVEAEPELALEAAVEPVIETAPEPAIEAAPEPVIEAAPEPVIEVVPETVAEAEPELAAIPPPAPQPAAPPPPRPSPPPPAAKPAPRRPTPEYTSDEPTMVPAGRVREAIQLPPAVKGAPRGKPAAAKGPLPRLLLIAGVTAVVGLGAFYGAKRFQKVPPVLMSVAPPKVEVGQTLTLSGGGFTSDAAAHVVRFGSQPGQVTSASETTLAVKVPDVKVTTGSTSVQVAVEVGGLKSNALLVRVSATPRVAGLDPDVAMPGDEVAARGANLAGSPLGVRVGEQTAEVVEAKGTSLRFRVPELVVDQGASVPVVVLVGSETSKPVPLLVGRLPLLIEVSPARGAAGERVVLKGRGFDPSPGGNRVRFGTQPALVLAASANELTVAAPACGMDAQAQERVTVEAKGATSTAERVFTVTRASSGAYTPRYFPAPVPDHPGHDHAFVANELGPVLLLTGKAQAPSTAERAEQVAKALNDLVQAAQSGGAVGLEARSKPAPGVALAGQAQLLVAATGPDAAGYQEAWDASAKPAPVAPEGLARYWTALLEDQLLLFVRHERPHRLLELTPRGKVFADLYADAVRRGGPGAGVQMTLVSPLAPPMARALREAALLLPAPGQARAAAAIEGRWRGTMEETGAGPRDIELRLRLEAGRLTGSLATRAGGLTMDIPLREASYDKGVLRFVLVLRGAPRHFEGTVAGDSVTGTVSTEAGAKDAVGRFSLKFVG